MAGIMSFASMVTSQGRPFKAHISSEGHYDAGGEWVAGAKATIESVGVILPVSNDLLNYENGGVYTTKEKRLLCLDAIPVGARVEYKGNVYAVEAFKDYTDYTDVHFYILRWREK